MKTERTFKIRGNEKDVETIAKLLRHMEYLGNVGASRNLLVRVDGDGFGRIQVFNEDGTPIDRDHYNLEQSHGAIVGTYDIGE